MPGAKSLLAIVVAFCFGHSQSFAQMKVGANPTTINLGSVLELESTTQGVLLPRVALANANTTWQLAGAPVEGMFVYNTNTLTGGTGAGIYYWYNSKWNYVQNGAAAVNTAWLLTGNSTTTPGTYAALGANFLGTIDGVDLSIRTTSAERMRISAAGQIGINQNFVATNQLGVTTAVAANTAIVGQNTTASGVSTGTGILGTTIQSLGYGVRGTNSNAAGTGVWGESSSASGASTGIGVLGTSIQSLGYGMRGTNSNAAGTGIWGESSAGSGVSTGIGVLGTTLQSLGNGVKGTNTNNAGTAILGQNLAVSSTGVGTGVSGSTLQSLGYGVKGTNSNVAGTGVWGESSAASGASTGIGVLGTSIQSLGYGVKGTNGNAAGIAILGQNTVASGTGGNGIGVEGLAAQSYNSGTGTNGYGVVALNSNTSGTGLYAAGNGLGLNYNFLINGSGAMFVGNVGAYGYSPVASGLGIYGKNDNTGAFQQGVYGTYNAFGWGAGVTGYGAGGTALLPGTTLDIGVYGTSDVYGVYGVGDIYGVYGIGDNTGVFGRSSNSSGTGVWGISSYGDIGTAGVLGSQFSNATTPFTLVPIGGAGASFTGNGTDTKNKIIIGVAGFANYGNTDTGNGTAGKPSYFAGGYFATRLQQTSPYSPTTYAYVGVQNNGTQYKILGTGGVSTIVKDLDNKRVVLFAPEAPESLFEDYGFGKLENGKTHIDIDPIFAKNITVNDKHPLRVFIQLNGDCNGVYTTNINGNGFDVVELKGGNSNVKFVWHVVGNRADEYDDNGLMASKNADLRFPPGPGPLDAKNISNEKMSDNSGDNLKKDLNSKERIENPVNPLLKSKIQDKKTDPPPAPKKD